VGARSKRAVRSGAAVQQFAAPDAAPRPDSAGAELDGAPVRLAAPLLEAAQGGPWRAVAQDEPWRRVPQDGPRQHVARPFSARGHTPRCLPRSRRRQEQMLQSDRQAEA
jgi:hypothetical protein